jgi:hypothetical protein
MAERQKGGQPGNQNAVTHGRYSRVKKSARRAEAANVEQRPKNGWRRSPPGTGMRRALK